MLAAILNGKRTEFLLRCWLPSVSCYQHRDKPELTGTLTT